MSNSPPSGNDARLLPVDGPMDNNTVITNRIRALLTRPKTPNRYLVERELARGGMGVIHAAADQDLQRISAMKVIGAALMDDERRVKAFIEEARITARLEHPNIIPVHEIGIRPDTGQPYYVMKLVDGEALSEIIFKLADNNTQYTRKYNRHVLLDIFRKVCNAIAFSHSRNIIHRDIKPENIMVGDYGEVLLMDWGLAKYVNAPETVSEAYFEAIGAAQHFSSAEQTQDGIIKGSLAYISPEQAFGELSEVDHQTDIFLLGATLYHMFTHHPPYDADSIPEVLRKAETCDYQAPSLRNPMAQIPLALERIILKAMSPMKRNRYLTVKEMIDDLDAFIAGKRVCGRHIFAPGEDLIRFGDQSRDTYVIIRGRVEVSREVDGRKSLIATLGKGEIIGEMAGITHKQRSATVTAVETTETLVISHELMLEELEKLPPWMEKIVFSMADRVQTLDQHLHPFLMANCAYPVLNQIYLVFLAAAAATRGLGQIAMIERDLLREITINLGIHSEPAKRVLDVLVRGSLLVRQNGNEIHVPKMDMLHLFVDFCRIRFDITGGIQRSERLTLTTDQDTRFKSILRKLQAL